MTENILIFVAGALSAAAALLLLVFWFDAQNSKRVLHVRLKIAADVAELKNAKLVLDRVEPSLRKQLKQLLNYELGNTPNKRMLDTIMEMTALTVEAYVRGLKIPELEQS